MKALKTRLQWPQRKSRTGSRPRRWTTMRSPSMAARAGQPVGVQPVDELGVAGLLVHQVGDREVHGWPPDRDDGMWCHPSIPRPALAVNYQHHLADMSRFSGPDM